MRDRDITVKAEHAAANPAGLCVNSPERAPQVPKRLVIVADDYGIGPEVSRGILDLARAGRISATVLLVNSPYARGAVDLWRKTAPDFAVGWHPCLTLDRPVLAPRLVPTLVDRSGKFHALPRLLLGVFSHTVRFSELLAELRAQLDRFIRWTGTPPRLVNGHHHVHVLPLVRDALSRLLREYAPEAYVRRVVESPIIGRTVQDARMKRRFLTAMGNSDACRFAFRDQPGNQYLLGLATPDRASAPDFFLRWVNAIEPGTHELACHPGHVDRSLLGRDVNVHDPASLNPRKFELEHLLSGALHRELESRGIETLDSHRLVEAPKVLWPEAA